MLLKTSKMWYNIIGDMYANSSAKQSYPNNGYIYCFRCYFWYIKKL